MGRSAFQLQVSLISIRTCWRFGFVLRRFTYCASADRPRLSPNPDSDRSFKDVYRWPLSFRRGLRSGSGHLVRPYDGAFPVTEILQSPIETRKLGSGGGEIRTHEAFQPSGFQDRRDQPLCHPSRPIRVGNSVLQYSVTPSQIVHSRWAYEFLDVVICSCELVACLSTRSSSQ